MGRPREKFKSFDYALITPINYTPVDLIVEGNDVKLDVGTANVQLRTIRVLEPTFGQILKANHAIDGLQTELGTYNLVHNSLSNMFEADKTVSVVEEMFATLKRIMDTMAGMKPSTNLLLRAQAIRDIFGATYLDFGKPKTSLIDVENNRFITSVDFEKIGGPDAMRLCEEISDVFFSGLVSALQ